MTLFVDRIVVPWLWFLAEWSLRWGVVIAAIAAWLALRPPRRAATRHLLCVVAGIAGLLLSVSPRWETGLVLRHRRPALPAARTASEIACGPGCTTRRDRADFRDAVRAVSPEPPHPDVPADRQADSRLPRCLGVWCVACPGARRRHGLGCQARRCCWHACSRARSSCNDCGAVAMPSVEGSLQLLDACRAALGTVAARAAGGAPGGRVADRPRRLAAGRARAARLGRLARGRPSRLLDARAGAPGSRRRLGQARPGAGPGPVLLPPPGALAARPARSRARAALRRGGRGPGCRPGRLCPPPPRPGPTARPAPARCGRIPPGLAPLPRPPHRRGPNRATPGG